MRLVETYTANEAVALDVGVLKVAGSSRPAVLYTQAERRRSII